MKTNLLKSALLLLVVTCSVNMMADSSVAVLSWYMGEGGTAATSANSITGATGCDAEGFTIAITGNNTKNWSAGNGDITIDTKTYKTLKNSNGAQNTVTLPEGMYASRVDFYVTTNADDGDGVLSEFNGISCSDVVSSRQNYANPTRIIKKFTEGVNSFTFTFSTKQVCFIAVVTYSDSQEIIVQQNTVTFANNDAGAEGTVPAAVDVIEEESIKIPANRTLYKEGYTLTGWNDGENTYAIGAEFTPAADVTLTPVFTENAFDVLTATSDITVLWDFQTKNGAPVVAWEGANAGTGFLVAQAILGNNQVDVKLTVDATSGKFNNKSSDSWCQINTGTLLTFPSKKAATVVLYAYQDPTDNSLDNNAGTYTYNNNIATYTVGETAGTSVLTFGAAGRYYRYLEVTYPASSATALEKTDANAKASKILRNGILLIEKNGKTINVLGQPVR